MSTISETCSCGAQFEYSGSPSSIALLVARWRMDHRHEPATATAKAEPPVEVHAVTGTHHQAGVVRTGPVGRKAVGFQHDQPTTLEEKS